MQKILQLILVWLLRHVQQPWSAKFYNALARICAFTAIETVFFQESPEGLRVLLVPRSPDDKFYPNELHSAGTMLRGSDPNDRSAYSFNEPFKRVQKELGSDRVQGTLVDVLLHRTPRGPELALIFICDKPSFANPKAQWLLVSEVLTDPERFNLIEHHEPIIRAAHKSRWVARMKNGGLQPEDFEEGILPEDIRRNLLTSSALWLGNQQGVPPWLFEARLCSGFGLNVSYELVTLVVDGGGKPTHILLNQRPEDDNVYPGRPWYCSGKIMLKGIPAHERGKSLGLTDETGIAGEHHFAGVVEVTNDPRGAGNIRKGHWLLIVFAQRLKQIPAEYTGKFFPISEMPDNLIWAHGTKGGIIETALRYIETEGQCVFSSLRHPD